MDLILRLMANREQKSSSTIVSKRTGSMRTLTSNSNGCGYWERPIIRLDVTTLNKEYLGGASRSPDGAKIATWQGKKLVVWDINDGEIASVPAMASDAETGPIAWSPDSQALIYVRNHIRFDTDTGPSRSVP